MTIGKTIIEMIKKKVHHQLPRLSQKGCHGKFRLMGYYTIE
jgi:hypothetical protein